MFDISADKLLLFFVSFFLFGINCLLLYRYWRSKISAFIVSLLLFVALFLTWLYFICNYFTGDGITESVVFHVLGGMGGVPIGAFGSLIISSILCLVFILFLCIFIYRFISSSYRRFHWQSLFPVFLIIFSFPVNPAVSDIYQVFQPELVAMSFGGELGYSSRPEGYVKLDSPQFDSRVGKPNIIYLYLESFERTYLDKKRFPGLAPNMNRLKNKAIDFVNIRQAYATGWTIAGMVASQCGTPLMTPVGINRTEGLSGFLPDIVCMGDILKSQNYHLVYMGGADLRFSNKGFFYRDHGFDEIVGRKKLNEVIPDSSYVSKWGIYDDNLLNLVGSKVASLASAERPYALFALTLDTHAPEGYPSASCADKKYGDGSDPMLNAVHCSDAMVGEFVDELLSRGLLENTILVLASDHLAMHNTASYILDDMDRRDLLLVFPPDGRSDRVVRHGTTMDIAPTLLSLQGTDVPAIGFGRNLLADKSEVDYPIPAQLDKVISSHRKFFMDQWSFDQLESGITIIPEQNLIKLSDGKVVSLPVLIYFDDDRSVKKILFEGMNSPDLVKEVRGLPDSSSYVMIDLCTAIALIPFDEKRKWCMEKAGPERIKEVSVIDRYIYIDRKELF